MKKPIIAVDVDDVLAAEAEFVIAYSNEHWGHSLSLDDYHEYWPEMWGVDLAETERRAAILHEPGIVSTYRLLEQGRKVLQGLAKNYTLVIVTSRRSATKGETIDWLNHNFGDIFSEVRFTGFYDDGRATGYTLTKADILKEMTVDFLIDDQPKHCFAAAEHGIEVILFGDYGVSRHLELPAHVTRCGNWAAVMEYFDAQR